MAVKVMTYYILESVNGIIIFILLETKQINNLYHAPVTDNLISS